VLPEIVEAVGRRATIIVDGGFMRGTDIVKAIALGANAVGIGRLVGLAMAAGAEEGVVRALELLEEEVMICLGLLGVNSLDELNPTYLCPAEPVRPAHVLSAFPLLDEGY
jgi:glycolate oxidase